MSDAVAVFIDDHGTPSVVGPFDTLDDAAVYAKAYAIEEMDSKSRRITKIASIHPPEHNWKEKLDGSV